MLPMSFSFSAEGSRTQCIDKLNVVTVHAQSADGQYARGLVLAFLADAPESAAVTYKISAYGHRDPGGASYPSLSISLVTELSEVTAAADENPNAAYGALATREGPRFPPPPRPRTVPPPGGRPGTFLPPG